MGPRSILAHKMGVRLADYVVNECGFAADLGAEKYFDIVMRRSGIQPAAAVLVVTAQSLRAQGEGKLESGFAQSGASHQIVAGLWCCRLVVAINRFPTDTAGGPGDDCDGMLAAGSTVRAG